jgi:site-specific DNA-methyltransferase (adenine-specific)/site-specific DNA-methyltransferase (cytosine-N4-specific)
VTDDVRTPRTAGPGDLPLVLIDIASKQPHPRNYNQHPAEQIDELAESLGRPWGQYKPVAFWQDFWICGHGVVEGAKKRGWSQIWAHDVSYLSEADAIALMGADNELPHGSKPDAQRLLDLVTYAREHGTTVPGVTNERLAEIAALARVQQLAGDSDGDGPDLTDKAAELQEKWAVRAGDVWAIGEHLIICGDCREPATWTRLLAAAGVDKVNGVFTSPPYAEQRKEQYGGVPTAEYVAWWEAVQANVRAHLAGDGSFFVNIKPHCEDGERVLYVFDLVLAMRRQWGWRFIDELAWKRPALPGNMGPRFKGEIEPVYHFAPGIAPKFRPQAVLITDTDLSRMKIYDDTDGSVTLGSAYSGQGGGSVKSKNFAGALPGNVIEATRGFAVNPGHGAVFPVALPAFFVQAYSDPGDVWCDPFLGSGTTIVAAHQHQRRGVGIERLEKYVAVCLERLQTVTGATPARLEAIPCP